MADKGDDICGGTGMRTGEGHVQVSGGRIWYECLEGGPGTPLLIIHGGPGFPHDYLEPLMALRDDRPLIFYDQLGCGNSDRPHDLGFWTMERFMEEIVILRDRLDLRELHMFGHSWGSILALNYYSCHRPLGVRSMILASPSMSIPRSYLDMRRYLEEMPPDVVEAVRRGEEAQDTSSPAFKDAVRAYNRTHLCRVDPPPECMRRAHRKSSREIADHFLGWRDFKITGYLKDYDCTDLLADIDVPTLFVCGEHDDACPDSTRLYQSMVHGSELEIVPGASHNPQLEKPEEYLRIIRSFLSRNDRRNEP